MTERETKIVQAIKQYLAAGLAVIPLRQRDKLPCEKWERFATERPDGAQWTAWWKEYRGCNIAVVYSSSAAPEGKQLVCVDTDSEEAEAWVQQQQELPSTPTVKTAKGRHRYFYTDATLRHFAPKPSDPAWMPEVRAEVHFSVLPPSIHPSGIEYAWELDLSTPIADLPAWGVALMERKWQAEQRRATERTDDVAADGCTSYGRKALERETDDLGRALQGTRNNALNAAAFALGQLVSGGELAEPVVVRALLAACERNGLMADDGPQRCEITVQSGLRDGMASPRSAPHDERPHRAAQEAPQSPATMTPEEEASLLSSAAHSVNAVQTYTPPAVASKGAVPIADLAAEIIDTVEKRRNLPAGIYGLRSGWPTVDAHFGGFKWQGLIIVMGGSGIGKTTLARHFAFATSEWLTRVNADSRILFYALEGGLEQFLWYWAGYSHGVPLRCYSPGGEDYATDVDREAMMDAYATFAGLPIVLSEERDGDRIRCDIERKVADGEVEAVILDNIQKVSFNGGHPFERNKHLAAWFADFAKATDIPVLALSQVNEFKGQADSPRGGPEWYHEAGCVLVAQRGETGMSKDEALKTNISRLSNRKLRYAVEGIMPEVRLTMDLRTQRLHEERSPVIAGYSGAPEREVEPWPNN